MRGRRQPAEVRRHIAAATCAGPSGDAELVRVAGARSGQPVVAWTARESGHLLVRAAAGSGRKKFRFKPLHIPRS